MNTKDKAPEWAEDSSSLKRTKVAFLLDQSGSMGSCRDQAISTFNEQVDTVREKAKEDNHDVTVSLAVFNDKVIKKFFDVEPDYLTKLDKDSYRPGGMTALYDAIMLMVNDLRKSPHAIDPNTSFLLFIVTDGYENASSEASVREVPGLLKELQSTGRWTIMYAGAGHNVTEVVEKLHIPKGNTLQFSTDQQGFSNMRCSSKAAMDGYLSSRTQGVTSSETLFSADGTVSDESSPAS